MKLSQWRFHEPMHGFIHPVQSLTLDFKSIYYKKLRDSPSVV
jgi:hypothetical protein